MRSIARLLDRLSDVIEAAGRFVLVLALVGLVVIVGLQVADRHITDVPIVSPDAYARILLIWITFVGFALAGRAGMAIRVDLLDHWLPQRWQRGLRILFDALKIGVLGLLALKGWLLVDVGFDQPILGTELSTAVPNAGLWVATLMMIVFLIADIAAVLTGQPRWADSARALELQVD